MRLGVHTNKPFADGYDDLSALAAAGLDLSRDTRAAAVERVLERVQALVELVQECPPRGASPADRCGPAVEAVAGVPDSRRRKPAMADQPHIDGRRVPWHRRSEHHTAAMAGTAAISITEVPMGSSRIYVGYGATITVRPASIRMRMECRRRDGGRA